MEIKSVVSSNDTSITLTQDVSKGQNMDAFSELLAMLFSNMLIPSSSQNSLMLNQDNNTDSTNTVGNNIDLNNMLSIIDNLRISAGQLKDTESIQNFVNSNGSSILSNLLSKNTDFQKLLNLTDKVPAELQDFINTINNQSSKEAESLSAKLGNNTADIIPEQLNKNITTSEVKTILDLMNIQADENKTLSLSKAISDALNTQTDVNKTLSLPKSILDALNTQTDVNKTLSTSKAISETLNIPVKNNTAVSELKKISELFNVNTTAIKAEKSSMEELKVPNNSSAIRYADNIKSIKNIIETGTDGKNNSADAQGEVKVIKPEVKTITTLQTANNFEQVNGLNNTKNDNTINITQQPKVPESTLIKNPQDIIDITVEKFKTLKLPGSTEVTVKLRPEELGDVSLKLVLEKGQINGSITADRKEVVLMLQNNLEQLKTDLKNNNVNLNNITVNIQAGEDFESKNSRKGFSNKQNKNNHRIVQAFEEEIQSYDLQEGLNIIA